MKTQTISRSLIFLIVLISIYGCETKSSDPGNCDETKYDKPISRDLHPEILFNPDTLPGKDHINWKASGLLVTGTIQKMYCNGTSGTTMDFFYNTAPIDHTYDDFRSSHHVIQNYGFNFNHEKDYLFVIWRVKYTFADGKNYESEEIIEKFYFLDIDYNSIIGEYCIGLWARKGLQYYEVTGK